MEGCRKVQEDDARGSRRMQKEGAAPAGPCRAWQSRTGQDRAGRGRTGQGSGGGAEPGPAPLGRGQGLAVGPALPCPARLSGGSDGAAGLAAIARLLRLLRRGGGGAREGAPAQVRAGRGMRPPGTSPSCPRCALLRSPRCHRASFPCPILSRRDRAAPRSLSCIPCPPHPLAVPRPQGRASASFRTLGFQ